MLVRKSFQFRLWPTKKQAKALQAQLDECRWLYNQLLEQRKLAHEELDLSLSKYQQSRYNSFYYPQSRFSLIGKELKLSKIGGIRMKMHRPYEGEIKTCTLRKNASGDWDVSLSCEASVEPLAPKQDAIGIDVGVAHFATLSNGKEIANPRFFKCGEKALAKGQRKLAKLKKGAQEWCKQGKALAKIHQRTSNQRRDFCHKESKTIIDQYQYICVEDLDIKKMVEGSHLAKRDLKAAQNILALELDGLGVIPRSLRP